MGFWGIEVKPGKPVHYQFSELEGRVNVTQATLGSGDSKERSALQCSIGEAEPVFLCSLLPNKVECCPLNLEFEEDEIVSFKVVGPRSIHLSGILLIDGGDEECCDSDSFGEDIAGTDTEESSEYDSQGEYDDEFINDGDLDMLPPSPVRKSGVVIEEIEDDEKPTGPEKGAQRPKKIKSKDSRDAPVLESEDEDGFPVSSSKKPDTEAEKPEVDNAKKQEKDVGDDSTGLKRKIESVEKDGQQESKKKKKKQKQKEQDEVGKTHESKPEEESMVLLSKEKGQKLVNGKCDNAPSENGSEKKKKKNKKNKKGQDEENTNMARDQTVTATGDKQKSELQMGEESEPSQVRSFPNGLVIEELAMGKPDGKRASLGKQVSVRYIGKLKKNGKIFDSNVGKAPFRFRLGVGQVIKGWDVGVNGMRIGDKRRLTIPPAMGYGAKGAGGVIPQNAWLVFDVELVDVR